MYYITGDKHRDFSNVEKFCKEKETSKNDTLIVLGDAGINYMLDYHDIKYKRYLESLPITLFCIHGNHEQRPNAIKSYVYDDIRGVYYEPEFPHITFARDGNLYEFNGKEYMVVGGAYSVDKEYRMLRNLRWWDNEQPDCETKEDVVWTLENICSWDVDGMLTHTCPIKYQPIEAFLGNIDQKKVDKTTEVFLDLIEDKLNYKTWYCGHWHIDKSIEKMRFLFNDIIELK